jgi:hypothetical protein
LPVELISFSAYCNEGYTSLHWSTASEFGNNYFSIERSADGVDFESIGTVQGAGYSSVPQNYQFTDVFLPEMQGRSTELYYRLKQTDYNGEHGYSPIASVRFPCQDAGIVVLPNPSSGIFSVSGLTPGSLLSVYTVLGEQIFLQQADSQFSTVNLSAAPKGVYFLKCVSGSKEYTRTVVLH